jgi:hypothetical protein
VNCNECTRCSGSGLLNYHQIREAWPEFAGEAADVLAALEGAGLELGVDHDVQVCDCCGDGETWHGEPGQHNHDDAVGGVSACS